MKKILLLIVGLVCFSGAAVQEQEKYQKDTSKMMLKKLEYSKDIMEGLTVENFDKITEAAQNLMLMSHEAEWKVVTTPEYLKASSEFRATVSRLREAGKKKNLDGATIAYFEVTLNCVRCHRQLRQNKDYNDKKKKSSSGKSK